MRRSLPYCFLVGSLLITVAAGGQAAVPTLKANTRIVVVDVVVTDSKQNAVRNLKATDFSLLEKNEAQTITHFEEHSALTAGATAKLPPMPTGRT